MERKTKIVATISDMCCSKEFIASLYEAGMNVVRINSAHASIEGADELVNNVRAVSESIALLIDTKGPEVRTTVTAEKAGFRVEAGQKISIKGGAETTTPECIYVTCETIVENVPVGSSFLIDDGDILISIIDKTADTLVGEVKNSGTIKSRKSVNIPNVHIPLPSLTDKDKKYLEWAIDRNIDFVAHSFVRNKADLKEVQDILDAHNSPMKIISKIENQEGVDNIDEILEHTYGVMVARGDLGIEIPGEKIPIIQRALVKKCVENKTPVIVATQMLQSMTGNPRPTRAEISDVAGAIYQRADAIMLSGETAYGDYPVEAVQVMDKVAREIEQDTKTIVDVEFTQVNNEVTAQLSRSAVRACLNLPVEAVVIDTVSGRTGRYMASFRGSRPVYAVCYRKEVVRELALSYGIYPSYEEPLEYHSTFAYNTIAKLNASGRLKNEDLLVVVGGDYGAAKGASYLEISTVENLVEKLSKRVNK